MKKSFKNKHRLNKGGVALIAMLLGIFLVILSAVLNLIYIRPTNFKTEYKKRQLSDCLRTTTSEDTCYNKFGNK
jgi:hypothetical protein